MLNFTLGFRAALGVAFLASAVQAAAGAQLYLDPLYGYTKTADVLYGIGNTNSGGMNLLLDVYQPKDIGLAPVQANRPAVVIQDGGAWTSGEKDNGRVVTPAIYLAQRGYTVFIADYRQVGDGAISGPGPWQNLNFSGNGSGMGGLVKIYPGANIIRAGIEDFATAISFVRNNASTYGINPDLIAAAGGSAGAVNVMDLQYNNNPVNASYRAQAVVALVGTMYGDWDRVQPGGPPLFLLNNALDPVIWYGPDVEPNLHNRLQQTGIYYEQWMQDPDITDHNVHYDQHPLADTNDPWLADKYGDTSKDVLERMADFLAYHFAGGPVEIPQGPVVSVTSLEDQTVWNLDIYGHATAAATSAQGLFSPLGAAHDAGGNLLVGDFWQGKIYKVDSANQVATFASGAGVTTPTGLAVDGAGNVLVGNYLADQVHALDSSGSPTLLADGTQLIDQPFATAVDPLSGATYVANLAANQIIKIDSLGQASVFADASDGLFTPLSLAVDAAGNVFVGDGLLSKIFKFTPSGAGSVFADTADGLLTPTGLTFDDAGTLYVANYLGDNVLKFNSAGVGSVFSTVHRPFGISAVPSSASLSGFSAVPEPGALGLALCACAMLAVPALRTAGRAGCERQVKRPPR